MFVAYASIEAVEPGEELIPIAAAEYLSAVRNTLQRHRGLRDQVGPNTARTGAGLL